MILQYEAECADCGTVLPVGSDVRYYRRDRIYGKTCHPQLSKGDRALAAKAGRAKRDAWKAEQKAKSTPKRGKKGKPATSKPAGVVVAVADAIRLKAIQEVKALFPEATVAEVKELLDAA